jgi:ribonuclease HII
MWKQTQFKEMGISMNIRLFTSICFALALTTGAVFAQSAEMKQAHQAAAAAQICDLGLDDATSSALGDAVQRVEQKSGLAQSELDALFGEAQASAEGDKDGFCAGAAAIVAKVVKSAN